MFWSFWSVFIVLSLFESYHVEENTFFNWRKWNRFFFSYPFFANRENRRRHHGPRWPHGILETRDREIYQVQVQIGQHYCHEQIYPFCCGSRCHCSASSAQSVVQAREEGSGEEEETREEEEGHQEEEEGYQEEEEGHQEKDDKEEDDQEEDDQEESPGKEEEEDHEKEEGPGKEEEEGHKKAKSSRQEEEDHQEEKEGPRQEEEDHEEEMNVSAMRSFSLFTR